MNAKPNHPPSPRGRGSSGNPANRFERLAFAHDPGEEPEAVGTEVFIDSTRSVLTDNDSPDLSMERSLNPYRGCEHGCSYCFARPYHEYLGLGAGIDFETKLFAKPRAPELLREELSRRSYRPAAIALSSATDPYQPIERHLKLTRRCLEVLAETRHPVCIVTKGALVERDADLLAELASHGAAEVRMSLTTLDAALQRFLEPRAATPRARLATMRKLADAGISVGVNVSPIIPGLTDHEVPALVQAAAEAGATDASMTMVRLAHSLQEVFADWLERHVPTKKERVLRALREMHGGKLYDSRFGHRFRGSGPKAEQTFALFQLACKRAGIVRGSHKLNTGAFRPPSGGQMQLF